MIGDWTPGIGDPSLMGWLTVFSYYVTALLCLIAALGTDAYRHRSDRTFRFIISFLVAFLGICKQFDLPSAVTEIGRMIIRAEGLMYQRRIVQTVLMIVVAIGVIIAVGAALRKIRKTFLLRHTVTVVCLLYLVAFIMFRAISLHQWGTILDYTILGFRINWIGELAGIYGICLSIFFHYFSNRDG